MMVEPEPIPAESMAPEDCLQTRSTCSRPPRTPRWRISKTRSSSSRRQRGQAFKLLSWREFHFPTIHHLSDSKSPPGKLGGLFSHMSSRNNLIFSPICALKTMWNNMLDTSVLVGAHMPVVARKPEPIYSMVLSSGNLRVETSGIPIMYLTPLWKRGKQTWATIIEQGCGEVGRPTRPLWGAGVVS